MTSPFYDDASIANLSNVISTRRLAPYLAEAGALPRAIDLYVWNIRASAALYGPLSILEVVLRNALHRELKAIFGPSWHDAPGFLAAAESAALVAPPVREAPRQVTDIRAAVKEAKEQVEARLRRAARASGSPMRTVATTEDIVGATGFGFWTKLLNSDMEAPFWSRGLHRAFSHWSADQHAPRSVIAQRFSQLRRLRNRVMHFEPLLGRSLPNDLGSIVEACRWIEPTCAAWIEYHSSLDEVLRDRDRPRHPI
jgi:hypothetical protein